MKPPIEPTREFSRFAIHINTKANGFDAYVAIWTNRGRGHVVIGAPTLTELADRWAQITNSDFTPDKAQHVFICDQRAAAKTPLAGASESTSKTEQP
jgi:hypothetical protein